MTLPLTTPPHLRRRVLEICQDHARRVLDAIRELPLLLSSFLDGDVKSVENRRDSIIKLDKEATNLKRRLIVELTAAGALLLDREDFLRLVAIESEMVDYAVGVACRVSEMAGRKWKVKKEVLKDLIRLAETVLNTATRLRETIQSLSFSAERTGELAMNVESAEMIVDSLYRKIDLTIVKSGMDLATILILRDIARFLEEIADKAEDAADAARILSLTA